MASTYFSQGYIDAAFDGADFWSQDSAPVVAGDFWPASYFGGLFYGDDYWGQGIAPAVAFVTNVDPTLFVTLPSDDGDPSIPDIDPIQFLVTQ